MYLWAIAVLACVILMGLIDRQVLPVPRAWAAAPAAASVLIVLIWIINSVVSRAAWWEAGLGVVALVSTVLITWCMVLYLRRTGAFKNRRPRGAEDRTA
ncbi:hypothetical protein AB0333_04675 [Citricoccus sp. NPDC079358]|uniref:hypothetical protein n=1 Tax=Citricoccus sp. NPDC079358 TaxID=3154653 RepID=UPI00344BCFDD